MKTEFIVLPSMFAMIAFVIWVVANGWQRRQQWRLMTDFNTRLLDRLGSVKDLNDLLQTETGARLIGLFTSERGSLGARERILMAVQTGVVFIVLGLGFLFLDWRFVYNDDGACTVIGVVGLALGIGLILSAAVSYRVASALGLLESNVDGEPRRSTR